MTELDAAKARIEQLTKSLEKSRVFQAKAKILETEMASKQQEISKLVARLDELDEQDSGVSMFPRSSRISYSFQIQTVKSGQNATG